MLAYKKTLILSLLLGRSCIATKEVRKKENVSQNDGRGETVQQRGKSWTAWPELNAKTSLTHDFHHTVTEESATALKGSKTFQIQRPDIFRRIPIYHPLCQVPDGRNEERLRYQPTSSGKECSFEVRSKAVWT